MTQDWYLGLGLPMDPQVFLRLLALTLGRSLPCLFLNPFLGGQAVPAQVKMGMGAVFALILFPQLARYAGTAPDGLPFGFLMLKEVCIGVTLGFLSSLIFWAIATAGRLVDTQRGANQAETMVHQLKERTSFLGQFYLQTAVMVFLLLNGHHVYLRGYFHSFEVLPVWKFPVLASDMSVLIDDLTKMTGDLLMISLQLSGPAVLALFLTDAAFGILNRAAQQVNVFNLSQPVKMWLGLFLTMVSLGLVVEQFTKLFQVMLKDMTRWVGYLGR